MGFASDLPPLDHRQSPAPSSPLALVPSPALAWKPTHTVSIKGTLVNHWTISEAEECSPVGEGTLTVQFHTTVATRVWPYLDDYAGGGWNVGVPHGYKGQLVKAMEPAVGTTGFARGDCLIGDARRFDDTRALVGGNREGNLLLKTPKESAFRRPVVRLKGKAHKRSNFGDPGESSTNDVTRNVTVTFKRR